MKIDLLKNSFINISKNIYDSDFINLAKINDEKICFDDNTLFLSKSSKDKLNSHAMSTATRLAVVLHRTCSVTATGVQ